MFKLATILAFAVTTSALAHTGIRLQDLRRKLDRVMEYEGNGGSKTGSMYEWRIPNYNQADTELRAFVDFDDYITDAEYDFYWGFDQEREKHFEQSIPILKAMCNAFMPSLRLTEKDIRDALNQARTKRQPVIFVSKNILCTFSYQCSTPIEENDRYRCFVVRFDERRNAKPPQQQSSN